MKTSDRKEGEYVANVPACRQHSPVIRGVKKGARPVCGMEARNHTLFKLDTLSTATDQSVAKDLQYAQSKEKDKRTRTIARRN